MLDVSGPQVTDGWLLWLCYVQVCCLEVGLESWLCEDDGESVLCVACWTPDNESEWMLRVA